MRTAIILGTAFVLLVCPRLAAQPRERIESDPEGAVTIRLQGPTDGPDVCDTAPRDLPGLRNVLAYHENYYSGGAPAGEQGFATLARLGVRTIISVDGAAPDVAAARAHGIRTIHLPIGYDGFDERRRLELARASRDAMADGAVYVHCHHGRHRSAAAAGTVAVTLGWASPEAMVKRMRVSGTSPAYPGLYARAAEATPVSKARLDEIPADFPSVSMPRGLVKGMVEIEEAREHLLAIEKAGWRTPADHPDLASAAEAGRLADLLRLLIEDEVVRSKSPRFGRLLRESRDAAQRLEDAIVAGGSSTVLSARLEIVTRSCKACHVAYRD